VNPQSSAAEAGPPTKRRLRELGDLVSEARDQRKLTREQLATLVGRGVTTAWLRWLETSYRGPDGPRADYLRPVCEALGIWEQAKKIIGFGLLLLPLLAGQAAAGVAAWVIPGESPAPVDTASPPAEAGAGFRLVGSRLPEQWLATVAATPPAPVKTEVKEEPAPPLLVAASWCSLNWRKKADGQDADRQRAEGCTAGLGVALVRWRRAFVAAVIAEGQVGAGVGWTASRRGAVTIAVAAGVVFPYTKESGIDLRGWAPAVGATFGLSSLGGR